MLLKKIILSSCVALAVNFSSASGIPVADGASLTQNAQNHLKTIAEMANQLSALRDQISLAQDKLAVAKQEYDSISGYKDFLADFDLDQLSDYLNNLSDVNIDNISDLFPDANCDIETCSSDIIGLTQRYNMNAKYLETVDFLTDRVTDIQKKAKTATTPKAQSELITDIENTQNLIEVTHKFYENAKEKSELEEEIKQKNWKVGLRKQDKTFISSGKVSNAIDFGSGSFNSSSSKSGSSSIIGF